MEQKRGNTRAGEEREESGVLIVVVFQKRWKETVLSGYRVGESGCDRVSVPGEKSLQVSAEVQIALIGQLYLPLQAPREWSFAHLGKRCGEVLAPALLARMFLSIVFRHRCFFTPDDLLPFVRWNFFSKLAF
jgi:hypothetical protein